MNLLKYGEFITDSAIYDFILESKLIYSSRFINILNRMGDNKISKELLKLYTTDLDIQHNYIDITDQKDSVSFTPDRKVKELSKVETGVLWEVIDDSKYLANKASTKAKQKLNDAIFTALGYDVTEHEDQWEPSEGDLGRILKEVVSPTTGRIYVLFQEDDEDRSVVMNKAGLKEYVDDEVSIDSKIWRISRNNIKVGRLIRSILTASKVKFVDKDIEDFTNQYKATFDFITDDSKFEIVSGDDIKKWYNWNNYYTQNGTLGSSCMKYAECQEYFGIYCDNPKQVRMVILYTSDRSEIKGRAILWNLKSDGEDIQYLDRIYTNHDSDIELFKMYAEKNGFWYKVEQNSENDCEITNGKETISPTLIATLSDSDFDYYPYMDTLCYLNTDDDTISNKTLYANRELNDTSGEYDDI